MLEIERLESELGFDEKSKSSKTETLFDLSQTNLLQGLRRSGKWAKANEGIVTELTRRIQSQRQDSCYRVRRSAIPPNLADAVAGGICDAGADVLEIGLAGRRRFAAVSEFDACAGIEVTASHNPIDYNGMKIVGRGSNLE